MFDINGNKIQLKTDELAIPPFKDHYNNAKDKSYALKEIEYIIWLYKWNTPYVAYPENERSTRVAKDVFGDENYTPTAEVKELIKRFNEFQETPSTRLLKASQKTAEGLTATLEAYSNEPMDIDTSIKVSKLAKDVPAIVKALDVAMKQAKAEQLDSGRIKGGGILGLYE